MRIAVQESAGSLRLLDPAQIYYVEAAGGDSRVRTARRGLYRDPRPLVRWQALLEGHGFFRIHRSYLVNLGRVRRVRMRRDDPNDWEVQLDPPVNAVLPMSRQARRRIEAIVGF